MLEHLCTRSRLRGQQTRGAPAPLALARQRASAVRGLLAATRVIICQMTRACRSNFGPGACTPVCKHPRTSCGRSNAPAHTCSGGSSCLHTSVPTPERRSAPGTARSEIRTHCALEPTRPYRVGLPQRRSTGAIICVPEAHFLSKYACTL